MDTHLINQQFHNEIYSKLEFYQKKNVKNALESVPKHYLAYKMGLGKSIVALSIHYYNWINKSSDKPILIICPAYIKQNWQDEIYNWFNNLYNNFHSYKLLSVIISSNSFTKKHIKDTVKDINNSIFTIVNYEQVGKLNKLNILFNSLIVDESHYINNMDSQRSKQVAINIYNKSIKNVHKLPPTHYEFVSLLSGTPINTSAFDFVHAIKLLGYFSMFGSTLREFKNKFCNKVVDNFSYEGYKYVGLKNEKMWQSLISNFTFFADKSLIGDKLVGKKRHKIILELQNRKEYKLAEEDFKKFITDKSNRKMVDFYKLSKSSFISLSKLNTIGKLPSTINYIKELIKSKQKFVLVVNYQSSLDLLERELIKDKFIKLNSSFYKVSGKVKVEDRHKFINDFKNTYNDENCHKFIIASIKSISTGINLSFCDRAVILETCSEYYHLLQFEDRLYRRGQKRLSNIDYILADNTIELNKIYPKIENKIENYNNFSTLDEKESIIDLLI